MPNQNDLRKRRNALDPITPTKPKPAIKPKPVRKPKRRTVRPEEPLPPVE